MCIRDSLNGVKRFITNGDANLHLVLARSEEGTKDGRGLSMLIYDKNEGGVDVRLSLIHIYHFTLIIFIQNLFLHHSLTNGRHLWAVMAVCMAGVMVSFVSEAFGQSLPVYDTPDRSKIPAFPGADGAGKYTTNSNLAVLSMARRPVRSFSLRTNRQSLFSFG